MTHLPTGIKREEEGMEKPWFDAETGVVLLDDYVMEMDSYKKIAEDSVVTDAEIAELLRATVLRVECLAK